MALRSRASDVFISTYPKSGTTWMQQVVHQVRCGGDEDYTDIYDVVPWLEMALALNVDLTAQQAGGFRAFKTHRPYQELPKPGRYISVFRDPKTVVPSFYRFLADWYFEASGVSVDEFARLVYLASPDGHRNHFAQWLERSQEKNTLLLCYEDMLENPDQVPELIADFLEVPLDAATLARVKHNCSRSYMVANENLFDDHLVRQQLDASLGLPPGGGSSKVFSEKSDNTPGPELIAELDQLWADTVGLDSGFDNYLTLRQSMPNPLQARRLC